MKKTGLLFAIVFVTILAKAQYPLNFDFEKQGSEGLSRPWGWVFDVRSKGDKSQMDSLFKKSGKYSWNLQGSLTAASYWLDASRLKNKNIVLKGYYKTGNAVSKVKLENWTGDALSQFIKTDTDSALLENNTSVWSQFECHIRVGEQTSFVNIVIELGQKAEIWLDGFELYIDGKKHSEIEVAEPFSEKQLNWFSKHTYPLNGSKAGGNDGDLTAFNKLAGDAKVIALGESTHGTGNFFNMKHRVLEYAVKYMGVTVFVIEDNQVQAELINNYVLYGKGKLNSLMRGMFGVWYRQEVIDMIEWIKEWNRNNPVKVEFVGIDMQNPVLAFDSLSIFLGKNDPELATKSAKMLADFKANWQNGYSVTDSIKHIWHTVSKQHFELIKTNQNKWLKKAKNRTDSLGAEWALQYARLIHQNARSTMLGYMSFFRDSAMAQNLIWTLTLRKPKTRMLLWAHDTHIAKGQHPEKSWNYYNGIGMGSWLASYFGNNYKAFGFSTFKGSYLASPSYMDLYTLINCESFQAPKGSVDEALHQVSVKKKSTVLFLDLGQSKNLEWLNKPRPVRMGNHVCIEYPYGAKHAISYQFDGIFFMDETHGSTLVK